MFSCSQLARLIRGEFADVVHHYVTIDCRYPYEYNGGHIRVSVFATISSLFSSQIFLFLCLKQNVNLSYVSTQACARATDTPTHPQLQLSIQQAYIQTRMNAYNYTYINGLVDKLFFKLYMLTPIITDKMARDRTRMTWQCPCSTASYICEAILQKTSDQQTRRVSTHQL